MKITRTVPLFKKNTLKDLLDISSILDCDFILSSLKIRPITLKVHPHYIGIEDRDLNVEEDNFKFTDILSNSPGVDSDSAVIGELQHFGEDLLEDFHDPVNRYLLTCNYSFNNLTFTLVPDVSGNKRKLIHDFDFQLVVEFEVELAKPSIYVKEMLGLDGKSIGVKFQTDFLIPDADYNHWEVSTNESEDKQRMTHTNDVRLYTKEIQKKFEPGTKYSISVSYEDRQGDRVCEDVEPLSFMFDDNYKFILLDGVKK